MKLGWYAEGIVFNHFLLSIILSVYVDELWLRLSVRLWFGHCLL